MNRRDFLKSATFASTCLMVGFVPAGADSIVSELKPMSASFAQIIISNPQAVDTKSAIEESFGEGMRLSSMFSRFNPNGLIYAINHNTCLFDAPDELLEILRVSREICHTTQGAFDITKVDMPRYAINDAYSPAHSECPIVAGRHVHFTHPGLLVAILHKTENGPL